MRLNTITRVLLAGGLIGLLAGSVQAKQEVIERQPGFLVQKLAEGFSIPWGMAFVEANQLLISERQGRLWLLDIDSGQRRPVDGAPAVWAKGQGGLLDVAVAPDYHPGDWIYLTYSKALDGQGATTLARAKLSDGRLQDWQDLLVTESRSDSGRHFGSRIAFDGRGQLFFSIGDRGERPNGQDLTSHAGAIVRLKLDGAVPADNPFSDTDQALPELWSYGHRNPQGLAYDSEHQRLWAIEHGPRGGDELNLIEAGANYGWPVISYGKEYWGPIAVGEGTHKAGMEQPVKVYVPSIAPGSLMLYSGDAFPHWRGNLFAGALKLQHLNRIVIDDQGRELEEQRLLESLEQRIRALLQGPEGYIYLSTDSGLILRLMPSR